MYFPKQLFKRCFASLELWADYKVTFSILEKTLGPHWGKRWGTNEVNKLISFSGEIISTIGLQGIKTPTDITKLLLFLITDLPDKVHMDTAL